MGRGRKVGGGGMYGLMCFEMSMLRPWRNDIIDSVE